MLILSLFCFGLSALAMFELLLGFRSLRSLGDIAPESGPTAPAVSVIVAACNEERTIESGLRSLLLQDYENLEIVVVNDRSTDGTGAAIERVRGDFPRLQVVEIADLPAGWLGKTHALHCGADSATGDYLVFSDADVQLERSTIGRAAAAMQQGKLDHLALVFQNSSPGSLLNALISDIGAGLLWVIKPWRAHLAASKYFVGVGAFNMVRAETYRAVGGHDRIRLQVIDDLFLGKIIKRGGFSQDCLLAQEYVQVPWYQSVDELIAGLMKNVYAFFDYRLHYAFIGMSCLVAVVLLPYAGLIAAGGFARFIFLLCIIMRCIGIGSGMISSGIPASAALWLLLSPFISLYIIARAVASCLLAGGITWRGSFYPLAELKQQEWVLSGFFALPSGRTGGTGRTEGE